MSNTVKELIDQVRELERKIEDEIRRRSEELQYSIRNGKITFERELKSKNKALKQSLFEYIRGAKWPIILTAPVIYSLIMPMLMLDIFVSLYQLICFPVYNIPKVKRSEFLSFDRAKLDYLNSIEKFNCVYCSYGNGIIAFAREVAARTEQYWCPIKNARKLRGAHKRNSLFTDFGDGQQYRDNITIIKQQFDVENKPDDEST